jgi:hypothetical protein
MKRKLACAPVYLLIVIWFFISIPSCLAGNRESWMPLAVGNYWLYDESNGGKIKIRVAAADEIQGVMNFAVQRISVEGLLSDSGPYQTTIVAENENGILVYGKIVLGRAFQFKEPYYELVYPPMTGKCWEDTPEYADQPTPILVAVKNEIVAVDEMITTPAGQFMAIKVKTDIGRLTYFRWYARGIGLVKEAYQRGETINEKILTEYHLAQ